MTWPRLGHCPSASGFPLSPPSTSPAEGPQARPAGVAAGWLAGVGVIRSAVSSCWVPMEVRQNCRT